MEYKLGDKVVLLDTDSGHFPAGEVFRFMAYHPQGKDYVLLENSFKQTRYFQTRNVITAITMDNVEEHLKQVEDALKKVKEKV